MIKLMNIQRQHEEHAVEFEEAVLEVLRSGDYIGGENVKQFEKEFAAYVGAKHSISVGNGTDALVVAMRALGIGRGDEVITVGFTFFATAESIAAVGGVPVFVDVDSATYCMDPNLIVAAITPRTKAVMPVHIYGHSANMQAICDVAHKHGLYIIEDCAQAAGTLYKGQHVGTFGDVGCYSFFPTKNLGCDGDGGMIITNDDEVACAARSLAMHGSGLNGRLTLEKAYQRQGRTLPETMPVGSTKYYNYLVGYNSRLDAVQAAILRKKLPLLRDFVKRRRSLAETYNNALKNTTYRTPYEDADCRHSYYLYVLQHQNAQAVMKKLMQRGIGCCTYYPVPSHLQGAFAHLGYECNSLPITEELCYTTFAIPVFPELFEEEQFTVIEALLEIVDEI